MKTIGPATRIVVLLGWILGILLPLASLRRFSTSYRIVFDRVFDAEAAHVLMHTFLFAVLAFLISSVFPRRSPAWRVAPIAILGVGIVAVIQETIQLSCEQALINSDTIFDWCVDFNGALLGAMIFLRLLRKKWNHPSGNGVPELQFPETGQYASAKVGRESL